MTPNELKSMSSNLTKVNEWLDRIGETDQACRNEVIDQCKSDKEAMIYYLSRFNEMRG